MVIALDKGMSIKGIIVYFEKYSQNEIPQNVLIALKQWDTESKRITIRTVTIVSADDEYLLEELKSHKIIKKDVKNELSYVFEIESNAVNRVKKNIEKKNHFCIIE